MAEMSAVLRAGYEPQGDLATAASYAATGATVGSFIPGVGSVIGGIVGGVVGLFAGGGDEEPPSPFSIAKKYAVNQGWVPSGPESKQAFRKLLAEGDERALAIFQQAGGTKRELDKQLRAFTKKGGIVNGRSGVPSTLTAQIQLSNAITNQFSTAPDCDPRAEAVLRDLVAAIQQRGGL